MGALLLRAFLIWLRLRLLTFGVHLFSLFSFCPWREWFRRGPSTLIFSDSFYLTVFSSFFHFLYAGAPRAGRHDGLLVGNVLEVCILREQSRDIYLAPRPHLAFSRTYLWVTCCRNIGWLLLDFCLREADKTNTFCNSFAYLVTCTTIIK